MKFLGLINVFDKKIIFVCNTGNKRCTNAYQIVSDAGFDSNTNHVYLYSQNGNKKEFKLDRKDRIAKLIIDNITILLIHYQLINKFTRIRMFPYMSDRVYNICIAFTPYMVP